MKIIVTLVLGCMFALQAYGVVYAADKAPKRMPAGRVLERNLDRIAGELNLSPEQKEKVGVIMKDVNEKIKVERQKMNEAVKAIREESDKKVKAVLTSEQAKEFEASRAKHKEMMGKRKNNGSRPDRDER